MQQGCASARDSGFEKVDDTQSSRREDLLDVSSEDVQQVNCQVADLPGGPLAVQDIYPLTALQQGMLFHHIENETFDTYVLSVLFSARSHAHANVLIGHLESVINRHDALRSAVIWEHVSQPLQVVFRRVKLPVIEVLLKPDRDPIEQLREQARSGLHRFDLHRAPLMRAWVAHPADASQWYVVFQVHHMVCDHLSLIRIIEEVAAGLTGSNDSAPASIPFKNYVGRALADARRPESEAYFRNQLAGIDATTAPFGITDARVSSNLIQEYRAQLDPAVAQRLRSQCKRYHISPGRLFHAAWSLVVAHTSGRDDIVFGTVLLAAEQRARKQDESVLVGPCINTLPFRVSLADLSVAALVQTTGTELSELLTLDAVPLAVTQRCSSIKNGAPQFTSLFNFRRGDSQYRVNLGEHSGIEVLGMTGTRTGYPITMSVNDSGDGFEIISQTDHRLSSQRVASYLQASMASLVAALETDPNRPALALSILPREETDLLLCAFNDTQTEFPDRPVHEVFEHRASQSPDAPALTQDGVTMTYEQLNREANQLARLLIDRGVTPGDYVPVIMSRSARMVIAQLAILKCGSVYVPVDPEFPPERQAFIVNDCSARLILAATDERRFGPSVQWLDLTCASDDLARMPTDNLALPITATSAAYVMYTSGSTGVPKGVLVSHRGVVRLVINNGYTDITANDCFIHYSNPAFDASTFEVWGALLRGARLVVVSQETVLNPARFEAVLRQERVSIFWITVGLFNQYADALSSVFSRFRYVIVGGDVLDASVIKRVLKTAPPKSLLNAYGPTECTTFSTMHWIRELGDDCVSIPIGKPIANAQTYVLDRRLQLVPIGVVGELYIGGDGVADGYLNRPALTAERFLADPFSAAPAGRLYRTGDLCRMRADGVLEFVGRNDQQVKVRGFRVELGEIQARIEHHPDVKEAIVLTRPDDTGQKQIVCYFTPESPSQAPTVDALREHTRAALPHYMVPSAFVLLDKLPLNANGKVDRYALPAPGLSAQSTQEYEAPRGALELQLADLWRDLLGVERVGRHDNFFELGAHSLHVLQALLRTQEHRDIPITVKDIYNCPTVHDLAKRLRGKSLDLQQVDLAREAVLPRSITALPGACADRPHNVFMTGATGFVGRFLLARLLEDTDATVYCLLRGASEEQAHGNLKDKLIAHDLWRDEFSHRIVAVRGDLRRPNLGIDDSTFETLCHSIDTIHHCATSMNHLETYAMAKPANVGGAVELLKLATRHRPKLINYLSTASVFSSTLEPGARTVDEHTPIDHEVHLTSAGYAASKWVGEKLVALASERGIPCNIFRLGLIWADTQLGRYDELQREHRVLKSCLMSGIGIQQYTYEMPPTPVDYAAHAISHLAGSHPDGGGIFHISSVSSRISTGIFERCNQIMNLSLEIVPLFEWIRAIKWLCEKGLAMPVAPLIEFAFSMDEQTFHDYRARRQRLDFAARRTHEQLERAGIVAPVLDDHLLGLCLERMLAEDPELLEYANHTAVGGRTSAPLFALR